MLYFRILKNYNFISTERDDGCGAFVSGVLYEGVKSSRIRYPPTFISQIDGRPCEGVSLSEEAVDDFQDPISPRDLFKTSQFFVIEPSSEAPSCGKSVEGNTGKNRINSCVIKNDYPCYYTLVY